MPRVARIVIPNRPHHITQRGNNRQDVFFVDGDRKVYLSLLKEESAKHGLRVLGYCLMTNHVHLVAAPRREDSLAKALGRTHFRYTQYINALHGRSGHLWQNRFFSCSLDKAHFWAALRYVERNPLRAKLSRRPWTYPWSSAAAHVGKADRAELIDPAAWEKALAGLDWRMALMEPQEEDELDRIRLSTHTGRPLASDRFLSRLEHKFNRRLRPLPVGRPRQPKKKQPRHMK